MKCRARHLVTVFAAVLLTALMSVTALAATQLGATEEAYWDKGQTGVARWKKVEQAKEYEVKLYEGGDAPVKTVKVSGTKVDFSSCMEDGAWYTFTVRAVPKSGQKNVTSGEWVESDEYQAEGLGDTKGKWRTYSQGKKYEKEDGTSVVSQWYLIQSEWYYFNQEGYALVGWQQIDSKWYYLNDQGVMQTGWMDSNGSRYYLGTDGAMAIGWVQVKPGEWYYMDAEGRMMVNTDVDGCHLNEAGVWVP